MLLSDLGEGYEYSHAHNLPSYLTTTYYKGVFACANYSPSVSICEECEEHCSSVLSPGGAINLNKMVLNLQM